MGEKPNYRVIRFDARIRGYNAADWDENMPGVVMLFSREGDYLGKHYRYNGHWYSSDDWANIPDEYSLTPEGEIGYTLDLRALLCDAVGILHEEVKGE